MHRHRILAQFSLILSILNLVLAAPVLVQRIHKARHDELVVADDVAAMLKKWNAASDRSMSPRSPPIEMDPQPSSLSDGSLSSDHPSPQRLSADSAESDPSSAPPLHPDTPAPTLAAPLMTPEIPQSGEIPASLHDSASHPSSPGPEPSANQLPDGPQELQAERLPSQPLPAGSPSPPASLSDTNSWTSDVPHMPISDRLREFELVPVRVPTPGSDQATTTTGAHPLPDQSTPEGLAPMHHLTDGPTIHMLQPIVIPLHDGSFVDTELMKKIAVPAALGVVGLTMMVGGIADLVITAHHHKHDN